MSPGPIYAPVMESLGQLTAAEQEHFEERAAIVEYLADWPRPIAEAEARRALGERRWVETTVAPREVARPRGIGFVAEAPHAPGTASDARLGAASVGERRQDHAAVLD